MSKPRPRKQRPAAKASQTATATRGRVVKRRLQAAGVARRQAHVSAVTRRRRARRDAKG